MSGPRPAVVYWDTSALLSALLEDAHSPQARAWLGSEGVHFVSTLAAAEFHAVLSRLSREGVAAETLQEAARALASGPWLRITIGPPFAGLGPLAERWALRGADLWHLALALALQAERPDVVLLTFDRDLREAARGAGLGV